ncbi:MAG: 50S ribosomal protein L21 [Planctomycetes bacterium]|nr:50S ribosomal protein L21 [Planctomycetota bacterium]
MYAIIEDGGRQYKVNEGDHLLVDLRDNPAGGNTIQFDKVLMIGDGAGSKIGTPHLGGASVSATVLEELRTDKVYGIKMRRRKGYRKKWGHRQDMLRVRIDKISG